MSTDFDQIQEVGLQVKNILIGDPDQEEWYNDIFNSYFETGSFPEGLLDDIIGYLNSYDDDETKNLIIKVNDIINLDGPDNLLNEIFTEAEGEFDDEGASQVQSIQTISFEDDGGGEVEIDESDPKAYFPMKIKKIQDTLQISYDIAYLLNKKYGSTSIEKWLTSRENVLNALRIKIGKENIPNEKSQLTFKNIGVGECPICSADSEIYQLYCGHQYCKNCLLEEIREQLKYLALPVCRDTCEKDGKKCNAEFIQSDVYTILEGFPELIQKYDNVFIKNQVLCDPQVRLCSYCDSLITPIHSITSCFARCQHCHHVVCLKCNDEFHGPLTCSHKIDFFKIRKEEMDQLEEDQEAWYSREKRLQAYRREHKDPVFKYFDYHLRQIELKNKEAEKIEQQKYRENELYIKKLESEINALYTQSRSIHSGGGSVQKVNEIEEKIDNIRKEIQNKKRFGEILKDGFEKNKKERANMYNDADTEKEFFINAVSNESKFDFFLDQYRNLVNDVAYKSLNVAQSDEETIKRSTKECPKCHCPIEKSTGCNWMKCWCGFEFCYFCNESWLPKHSDHHKCPKYNTNTEKKTSTRFNNPNDKEFYPPPMSDETRKMYIRYNNLMMQYLKMKEAHDKFQIEMMKNANRKKLLDALMVEKTESSANIFADQLINNALFGKEVVMNGFPQMFYVMLQFDNANLLEFHIYQLDNIVNELFNLLENPENKEIHVFEKYITGIQLQAKIILEDSEKY